MEDKGEAKQMEEEVIIPSRSVLWDYIGASGGKFAITFLFIVIIISQVVSSGSDYFVSWW